MHANSRELKNPKRRTQNPEPPLFKTPGDTGDADDGFFRITPTEMHTTHSLQFAVHGLRLLRRDLSQDLRVLCIAEPLSPTRPIIDSCRPRSAPRSQRPYEKEPLGIATQKPLPSSFVWFLSSCSYSRVTVFTGRNRFVSLRDLRG
jgi:hypothetical protein